MFIDYARNSAGKEAMRKLAINRMIMFLSEKDRGWNFFELLEVALECGASLEEIAECGDHPKLEPIEFLNLWLSRHFVGNEILEE